jgi:metal-responsive CopG/Arc/MetJ family transcriptional regulator
MRTTSNISITLPKDLVDALAKAQQEETRSCSSIVSEAVAVYCEKREYKSLRDSLSKRAKEAGILTGEDIDRAVHEVKRDEAKKARKNHC